jgi:ABC-2 type transport system ATP-binding protein
VISHGVLRGAGTLEAVLGGADGAVTRVRAGEAGRLADALRGAGHTVNSGDDGALLVPGSPPEAIGRVAADQGVALSELVAVSRSLEEVFFELTGGEG